MIFLTLTFCKPVPIFCRHRAGFKLYNGIVENLGSAGPEASTHPPIR
jgi:hypothetical protein